MTESSGTHNIVELVTADALGQEIHEVEERIFRLLLVLGRILLELFLGATGTGKCADSVPHPNNRTMWYRRDVPRKYLSIVGDISIVRAYYLKEGEEGFLPSGRFAQSVLL